MPLHPARADEVSVVGIDFKIENDGAAPPAGHHLGRGPAVRRADAFAFGQTPEVHRVAAVQTVDRVAVRAGDDVVLAVAAFKRHARHRPFIPSRAPHQHHPAGPLLNYGAWLGTIWSRISTTQNRRLVSQMLLYHADSAYVRKKTNSLSRSLSFSFGPFW